MSSAVAFGAVFFFPRGDQVIGPALVEAGEFARAEVDFLRDHLPEDGVLYDVGANIGTVSIPLARALPGLTAYAFEPQLPIFRLLMRNIVVNGVTSVEAFPWALGEQDGPVEFPTPAVGDALNFGAIGRNVAGQATSLVVMRRLDSLGLPPPHLIKIDVEGFDLEVIGGAQGTIRQHRPIVFCEAHPSPKTQQVMRLLDSLGYHLYWFFAPFVSLDPAKPQSSRTIAGDINIAAFPNTTTPRWPLPRIKTVGENWHDRGKEFDYLRRYGYAP